MARKLPALLLAAAAAALVRALATRHGVGPFEYVTGILLVALLLRGALGSWRSARSAAR